MTKKTEAQNWRKFLGITEPKTGKASARAGGLIGKTSGSASGSGITDRDGNPDGSERETAENGDGSLNGGKALQVGDKGDRLTDLYDCETGEEVTIDGLGADGTEAYPSDFQDCKDPNEGDDPSYTWYHEMRINAGIGEPVVSREYTKNYDTARAWIKSQPYNWTIGNINNPPVLSNGYINGQVSNSGGGAVTPSYKRWTILAWNKNITPPPEGALEKKWPAVDKNHLVWNKEKNCFEPLCPDLNTQVLDKYNGCEDERILCDADGNKVKVKVDGDVVKVTQEKYGQTAEIKNGKVTAVKKLTESQLEAEFK